MRKKGLLAVLLTVALTVGSIMPVSASENVEIPRVADEASVTEPSEVSEELQPVIDVTGDNDEVSANDDTDTSVSDGTAENDVTSEPIEVTSEVATHESADEVVGTIDDSVYAELLDTEVTQSANSVSADALSGNKAAKAGVQTKPAYLSDGTFQMVKGQKWAVGAGAVTSDKKIIKVDKKGFATAKKTGTAEISIDGFTYKINVVSPSLDNKKVELAVGGTSKVSLNGVDAAFPVTWKTENANVAQVAHGTVYGTGKGKTKVYAFAGGKQYKVSVSVKDAPSTTYLMNTTLSKPAKIAVPNAAKTTWTGSGNEVTVNKGKATANVYECATVSGNEGHSLQIYGNSNNLNTTTGLAAAGKSSQYTIKMKPGEQFLIDFPMSHELPLWKSNKPYVAAVNEFGLVYADSPGIAKLTAKTAGKKVTIVVDVGAESTVISSNFVIEKPIVEGINGHDAIVIYYDNTSGEYSEKNLPPGTDPFDDGDRAEAHAVLFETNGGTYVAMQEVEDGKTVVRPSDPVRKDYVFDGWFRGNVLYNFDEPVFSDMTLVADWYQEGDEAARKAFVLFDANGGVFPDGSDYLVKKFPMNSILTSVDITPSWDGYTFIGWYYYDGTAVGSGDVVSKDTTIHAHWRNNTTGEIVGAASPLILFDNAHGGIAVRRVNSNGTVNAPVISWDGHRFDYWQYEDGSTYLAEDVFDEPAILTAQWTVIGSNPDGTYNIAYNLDGGTNDPANPYVYSVNDEFDIKNPTKENCAFQGWLVYVDGIRQGDGLDKSVRILRGTSGNIVCVANWTEARYSLSFNSTGGSEVSAKLLKFDEEFGTLPTPVREDGKKFAGWYYSEEDGAVKAKETDKMGAVDLTLYAKWGDSEFEVDYTSYPITYHLGDEDSEIKAVQVNPKLDYTKISDGFYLVNPTRQGYEFVGWTGTDLVNDPSKNTSVFVPRGSTGAREYWASWKELPGKSATYFNLTLTVGDTDGADVTKATYVFTGNSVGTGVINSGETVRVLGGTTVMMFAPTNGENAYYYDFWSSAETDPDSGEGRMFVFNIDKDSNVVLKCEKNMAYFTYDIDFDLNGGWFNKYIPKSSYTVKTPTFTIGEPTMTGHTFEGWTGTGLTTMVKTITIPQGSQGNKSYFANWSGANTYTLTFDPNGGVCSTPSKTVTFNEPYGTLPTPQKEHYDFDGWYTEAQYGTPVTSATVMAEEGVTVYAHWSPKTYRLTFNPNGGSVDPLYKDVTYGNTYGILPTPERDDFMFAGWFTQSTGGTEVTSSTAIDSDTTIYAHWSGASFTVNFDYQNATGGNTTLSKQVNYMGEFGPLPAPTRSYTVTYNANGGTTPSPSSKTVTYTFTGWYTAANGGTKIESTSIMSTRGATLYAHWTAPTYGDLPSCSRSASGGYTYSFKGWYTAASGGSNVTSTTTVNLTSNQTLYAQWNSTAQGATVTITYGGYISGVTVNGTRVSSGWSGTIKQGDVIVASGSIGSHYWYYYVGSSYFGRGSSARCTAPASSGTGTLNFYVVGDYYYYVDRGGACASWTFSAS